MLMLSLSLCLHCTYIAAHLRWGTDLSFCFVYVRALDPTGSAALSGAVSVGDQICELTPVMNVESGNDTAQQSASSLTLPEPINLIGASFDAVMGALASLEKTVQEMDVVFFRGTKAELKAICTGRDIAVEPDFITVTVIQNKGDGEREMIQQLTAPAGVNVRELLVSNGINVYQSVTRWTNCSGKQLCGTCIVNVPNGGSNTNRKSMDEASTLRENPETYRLSCITFAYGDITVETFPPINAAQWTR
jgi:ferredoxin